MTRHAGFVMRSALRNKRRTLLTVLSVAASLFLLVTLRTVLFELQSPPQAPEGDLRLWARHAVSLGSWLPIADKEKIRTVPGVKQVMAVSPFNGVYKDPGNFFIQFALEHESYFQSMPEVTISDAEKAAFYRERTGAIAGVRLMQRFGWKVGDRITLKGKLYPFDVDLQIVGSFRSPIASDEAVLVFRYDYLDELNGQAGRVSTFCIVAESKEALPQVAMAVDEMFRNSAAPTRTETEKAFVQNVLKMMGNVKLFIGGISAVVVFTILLVTAASLGMSIRERTAEVAVLRTLGYTSGGILFLLLSEAIVLSTAGAVIGCLGAKLLYSFGNLQGLTGIWIVRLRVQPEFVMAGILLGAVIGVVSAAVPAIRAARLPIAVAIRHVG